MGYIEKQQWWYEISDLNSGRYLYILHELDDVLWLTISDSCGLAVCRTTRGTGRIPGTIYASMARISGNKEISSIDFGESSLLINWILDSEATCHMTPQD